MSFWGVYRAYAGRLLQKKGEEQRRNDEICLAALSQFPRRPQSMSQHRGLSRGLSLNSSTHFVLRTTYNTASGVAVFVFSFYFLQY